MSLSVGCDIVSISRFSASLREGGAAFAERIFSPAECEGAAAERLAGIFAAKEAACKALGIPAGNWRRIHVTHLENGAPKIETDAPFASGAELSLSISHDGDTAFAVVIAQNGKTR